MIINVKPDDSRFSRRFEPVECLGNGVVLRANQGPIVMASTAELARRIDRMFARGEDGSLDRGWFTLVDAVENSDGSVGEGSIRAQWVSTGKRWESDFDLFVVQPPHLVAIIAPEQLGAIMMAVSIGAWSMAPQYCGQSFGVDCISASKGRVFVTGELGSPSPSRRDNIPFNRGPGTAVSMAATIAERGALGCNLRPDVLFRGLAGGADGSRMLYDVIARTPNGSGGFGIKRIPITRLCAGALAYASSVDKDFAWMPHAWRQLQTWDNPLEFTEINSGEWPEHRLEPAFASRLLPGCEHEGKV
jgi:hypothetical protein